ncbi:hypothetical protein [Chamaesiphon sp.]|uniref:hypothetical protein n=1 Tax=Chamaesiphon sp. TaxID=2814140 RepID=UPI003593009E
MSDLQSQLEQNASLTAEGKDQTIRTAFEVAAAIARNMGGKEPERNLSVSKKAAAQIQPSFKISKKASPVLEPAVAKVDPNPRGSGKSGFESLDRTLPRKKYLTMPVEVDGEKYQVTRYQGNMINVTRDDPQQGVTKTTYKDGKMNESGAEINKVLTKMPEIARAVSQALERSQETEISKPEAEVEIDPEVGNLGETEVEVEIDPEVEVTEPDWNQEVPKIPEEPVPKPAPEAEIFPAKPELEEPEPDRNEEVLKIPEEPTARKPDLEEEIPAKTEEPELPKKAEAESELLYGFDDKGEFIERPLDSAEAAAILALLEGREGEIVPGEAGKNLLIEFDGKTLFETNEKGEITTSAFSDPNVLAEIRKTDEMGLNKLRDYAQRYAAPKKEVKVSRGEVSAPETQQPATESPEQPPINVDIRAPEATERSPEAEIRNPEAELRSPQEEIRSPEAPSPQLEIEIERDMPESESFDPYSNSFSNDDDLDVGDYDWIEPDSPTAQSLNEPTMKASEPTVENYLAVLEESVLREELAGTNLNTRVANKDIGGHKFNRNVPNKQDGSYSITIKADPKSAPEKIGSVSKEGIFTASRDLKDPERIKEIAKAILIERGIELGERPQEDREAPDRESENIDFGEDRAAPDREVGAEARNR